MNHPGREINEQETVSALFCRGHMEGQQRSAMQSVASVQLGYIHLIALSSIIQCCSCHGSACVW